MQPHGTATDPQPLSHTPPVPALAVASPSVADVWRERRWSGDGWQPYFTQCRCSRDVLLQYITAGRAAGPRIRQVPFIGAFNSSALNFSPFPRKERLCLQRAGGEPPGRSIKGQGSGSSKAYSRSTNASA